MALKPKIGQESGFIELFFFIVEAGCYFERSYMHTELLNGQSMRWEETNIFQCFCILLQKFSISPHCIPSQNICACLQRALCCSLWGNAKHLRENTKPLRYHFFILSNIFFHLHVPLGAP